MATATATATAAAAVGSPFSKRNLKSKPWTSDPTFLRITSAPPRFQVSSLSHSLGAIEPVPLRSKRRVTTASAPVEQETAEVEEVAADVKEEEQSPPVNGGGEEEAEGGETAMNTKLYFGNLPYLCDSAQLAGIIQDYASPELVEVLYNRETGRSRGFAFVTMSTIEDCNAVIENLDGREYGGRTLRVNFSDKPKPKEPLYPETEHKLFVGNLSWSVTSESLAEAFKEYGHVVGARVLYDGESGRSRGYGFVSYSTKSEMDIALEALNGVELEGRSMRVSLAEGKRQ